MLAKKLKDNPNAAKIAERYIHRYRHDIPEIAAVQAFKHGVPGKMGANKAALLAALLSAGGIGLYNAVQ